MQEIAEDRRHPSRSGESCEHAPRPSAASSRPDAAWRRGGPGAEDCAVCLGAPGQERVSWPLPKRALFPFGGMDELNGP